MRAEVPEKSCSGLEYSLWRIKNAAHRNRLEKDFKKERKVILSAELKVEIINLYQGQSAL